LDARSRQPANNHRLKETSLSSKGRKKRSYQKQLKVGDEEEKQVTILKEGWRGSEKVGKRGKKNDG